MVLDKHVPEYSKARYTALVVSYIPTSRVYSLAHQRYTFPPGNPISSMPYLQWGLRTSDHLD
jgi:hypothetical protein